MIPIVKISSWLDEEKSLGSSDPDRVVLATASKSGIPHSRVVAIREITETAILFFTQRETQKVIDLTENSSASMTLWLPLQQREVVFDGNAEALTRKENQWYWETMPRDRQLRFIVNSSRPKSQMVSLDVLNEEYEVLLEKFYNEAIPMSDFYCGYRFTPKTIYFYTLTEGGFSEKTVVLTR